MPRTATTKKPETPPDVQPAARRRFLDLADNCFRDTERMYLNEAGVWCFREYTPTLNRGNRLPHAKCVDLAKACTLAGGGWEAADTNALDALLDRTRENPALHPDISDRFENAWHWAKEVDPSSPSGGAFSVGFDDGSGGWDSQCSDGFVVGSRLVPASQS